MASYLVNIEMLIEADSEDHARAVAIDLLYGSDGQRQLPEIVSNVDIFADLED